MWVGGRWVLTCAHVIGPEPRTVMVRFSFVGGDPIAATVAPYGWLAEPEGDLALLELDRDPPLLARPAPLRLARAVAGHLCAAYGYPSGHDSGVWSEPVATGQTVDRLQLTASDDRGHQIEKGFSGTGLFDTETGAVVGLVATRDRGKDVLGGFAIPLQAVVAAFPQLDPWVGWRLGTDLFLRQHWRPRARGVYEDTTPGWYFTGRTALLRELTGWMEDGPPGRTVRVVTGPAGTGKSAVLAWLCALSDPQLRTEIAAARPAALAGTTKVPAPGRVSAAVWARGLDADGAAGALAAALMLPVAPDAAVDDVLAAMADLDQSERDALVVVLDALDEAKTPREIARRLLVPLTRNLGVKVLAGTRPGRDDDLLKVFGERAMMYRLDDPAWFDRQDLADYAAACLRADFDLASSSGYRTDSEACGQVAAAIADTAGPNFLVAGLAARARADEPVIDVRTPGWRDLQRFPAEVGQAFDDYLSRFGDDETRARDLLRAAAYAEGAGLPADALWADMATALAAPRRYGSDDLAWLLDSAAAYLVESSDERGQVAHRIFHQALIDHLRPPDKEKRAQREITSSLITATHRAAGGPDWAQAPPYVLGHLATHAAAAKSGFDEDGQLDGLVKDGSFLAVAEPQQLLDVLNRVSEPQARRVAQIYRRAANRLVSADSGERAALLELVAYQEDPPLAADLIPRIPVPWRVRMVTRDPRPFHLTLPEHSNALVSVCLGELAGRPVLAAGDSRGTALIFDIPSNTVKYQFDGLHGPAGPFAFVQDNDRELFVACDQDRILFWNMSDNGLRIACLTHRQRSIRTLSLRKSGEVIYLAAVDGADRLALYSMRDGEFLELTDVGTDTCSAASIVAWGERAALIAAEGPSWDLVVRELPSLQELETVGHPLGKIRHLNVFECPGGRILGATNWQGAAMIWNTTDIELVASLAASEDTPEDAAFGEVDGHPALASLNFDTAEVYDLTTGQRPHSLRGAYRKLEAVDFGRVEGRSTVATAGTDGKARVWPLDVFSISASADSSVRGVAVALIGDKPMLAGAGVNGVRLHDLSETRLVRDLEPPGQDCWKVAFRCSNGRAVVAVGEESGNILVWDALSGELLHILHHGHRRVWNVDLAVEEGRIILASASLDGSIGLWDVQQGDLIEQFPAHDHGVSGVAFGRVDGNLTLASTGEDSVVRLWDVNTVSLVGSFATMEPRLLAVTQGTWKGRPVIGASGTGGIAYFWDVQSGALVMKLVGHTGWITGVAIRSVGNREQVVTSSDDNTIRIWDSAEAKPRVIDLDSAIYALAINEDIVAAGTVHGFVALAVEDSSR